VSIRASRESLCYTPGASCTNQSHPGRISVFAIGTLPAGIPLPAPQSPWMILNRMYFGRLPFSYPRKKTYRLNTARLFYFHVNWYRLRRNLRRPLFRGRIISA